MSALRESGAGGQLALTTERAERRAEAEFAAFHAENPQVMAEVVRLTRQAKQAGATRVGLRMVFEVIRWGELTTTGKPFKLNNNLAPHYARAVMERYPDLAGIYETRELQPPVPRSLAAAA